jgi:outer membrane receptor for ferrienterochelin and colicins
MKRYAVPPLALLLSLLVSPAVAQDAPIGVLVIAHGGSAEWNAAVKQAVDIARRTLPAEPAFLMGVPDQRPQEAYDRLVAAGAARVVVVPLLVSSHSAHAEQVTFIAGRRPDYPHAEHMKLQQLRGRVPVLLAGAMDDHPIVASILADRGRALSREPAREALVIVAHGPNGDEEAARWTETIRSLGRQVQRQVPFAEIDVRLLRDDAPKPVKDRALAELREAVERLGRTHRVIVVPLLVAPGRVADQIPQALAGLEFAWDGRTLLPDPRIAEWIVAQARAAAGAGTASGEPPRYAETVVVTATRTARPLEEVPVQTEVVEASEIEAVGARTIAEALPYWIGLEVVPGLAGETIQLQGVDAGGVLVLVDGQEVIGKIGGAVDLGNLLTADVERIEIVKGAASAVYGSDALGGVVNILTRRARQPFTASVEQRLESLGGLTTVATAGGRRGSWNGFATAERLSRDSYDLTPADPSTTGSAFTRFGATARAGYETAGGAGLSLSTRYYDDDALDVTAGRRGLFDDRVDDRRWQTMLEARVRPGNADTLALRGHVTRYSHLFERTARAGGVPVPDLTHESLSEVELQYDRPLGSRHLLTAGAEVERTAMTSDRIAGGRRSATASVGFLQDEWFVGPAVRLLVGVRYDRHSAFGSALSPKVGLLVRPSDRVRLRASFGEGFKAPEFKDLYVAFGNRAAGYQVVGNPDLRPETSRSVNGGLEIDSPARRVRLSLAGFHHRIDDLIDTLPAGRDPVTGLLTFRTANIGAARTQGVEAELALAPWEAIQGAVGYGWLDAVDRATGEPLPLRARHTIKTRAFAVVPGTRTGVAILFRRLGRRAFADTSGDGRIDDFAPAVSLVDARLVQPIRGGIELFVGAENLGGASDARYFPSPGRRVYAGATWRYAR